MNNNKILQNKEYHSYIEENYLYIPPEIQEILGNEEDKRKMLAERMLVEMKES